MDALIASDWSLDDVPCEWIVKVDDDLVDFDVVVGGLHQSLDVIGRLLHSLLTDDLLVELVHSQSLHEVYGESEGEVILDFSVGNLLLCEGPDFQAESHLFQYAAICLISLIVDVLGDNDGVILALLETGVDLQCWYLNDPFSIQLDNALIGPGDLIHVSGRYLQAAHFYLILASLGAAEVLIGLQVAGHEEF